jgi:SAM-dependent methyltransferase
MNKKERDELFDSHLPGNLHYHQTMLMDGVRNKLLFEAIRAHVSSETAFLDIGAGTGVWAILAAKLGAKRVVAVEIEENLIPIIFRHAQENGVADKIEIIHGDIDDVRVRGKFDVIVSELFGGDVFNQKTIDSFKNVNKRFLAPNGTLIPQKISRIAVPVRIAGSIQDVPAEVPVKCEFLKSLRLNYSWDATFFDRQKIKVLAEPKEVFEIDFRNAENILPAKQFSLSWQLDNLSECNAFAVYNNSTFTDEIKMDNFASQSWGAAIYEFQPFAEISGEIKFDLTIDERKKIWTVSLLSNGQTKSKTYSPAFVVPRARMAQQTTPYQRVRSLKLSKGNKKIKK